MFESVPKKTVVQLPQAESEKKGIIGGPRADSPEFMTGERAEAWRAVAAAYKARRLVGARPKRRRPTM